MRENKNIGSELDATALRIRGGGRRLVAAVIIDIIAALAVIVFGVLLWSSGLLPLKFFIPLCVILLLLCGVLTILSLGGRHLLRPTLGMIFNLLLALACVLGSYMVTKGVDTLRDIIGKRESSNHVGIYVRTDDPAKDLQDLESYAFGILGKDDRENTDKAIADLEEKLNGKKINYKEYTDKSVMTVDLLSGNIDAMFMNTSLLEVLSGAEGFEDINSKIREIYSTRIISEKPNTVIDMNQPSDTGYPDGVFTVYMSGIDTRSGYLVEKSRCDSNILAVINSKTKNVLLISIPRDYYVELALPEANGAKDKLTHAGIYGVQCSMDTVAKLFDIDVNYYFRVNFGGFEQIIDALGGITVYNDYYFESTVSFFEDEAGRYYSYPAGDINLTGEAALYFARERHAVSGGDRGRGLNQMKVIEAVADKMMSPAILKNYSNLLDQIKGNFEMSIPYDTVSELVREQLDSGTDWTFTTYNVDGAGDNQPPYSLGGLNAYVMVPYESTVSTAKDLISQVVDGKNPVVPETSAAGN